MKPTCNFLLCNFSGQINPFLNILAVIIFLPFALVYLMKTTNFIILQLSYILTIVWIFLLPLLITIGCHLIKYKNNLPKKEDGDQYLFRILVYLTVFMLFGMGTLGFIFYPKIKIVNINFVDYAILATLSVTSFSISSSRLEPQQREYARRLTTFSILIFILGMFTYFIVPNNSIIQNSLANSSTQNLTTSQLQVQTLIDNAYANGLEIGTLVGGMTATLSSIVFINVLHEKQKKTKRNKVNIIKI